MRKPKIKISGDWRYCNHQFLSIGKKVLIFPLSLLNAIGFWIRSGMHAGRTARRSLGMVVVVVASRSLRGQGSN